MNQDFLFNLLSNFLGEKSALNNFNLESLLSIASGFGLDLNNIEPIISLITKIMQKELSLIDLLPTFLPILLQFFMKKEQKKADAPCEIAPADISSFEPISDICDDEIFSAINSYFNSTVAS